MRKLFKPLLILLSFLLLFLGVRWGINAFNHSRNQDSAKQTAFRIEAELAKSATTEPLRQVLAISREGQYSDGLKGMTSLADNDCTATGGICTYLVPKTEIKWYEHLKAFILGRSQFTCDGADTTCQWRVATSNLVKQGSFEQMGWRWKQQLCNWSEYNFSGCAGDQQVLAAAVRLEGVDGPVSSLSSGDRFVLVAQPKEGTIEDSPMVTVKIKSSNDVWWRRLLGLSKEYPNWDRLDANGVGRNYHFAGREFPAGRYEITSLKVGHQAFQRIRLPFTVVGDSNKTTSLAPIKTAVAAGGDFVPSYELPTDELNRNPLLTLPTVALTVAGNTTVTAGSTIKLQWINQATSSCSASGAWSGQWIGTEATSGSQSLTAPAVTNPTAFSYTLNCTNDSGSNSSTVTMTVNPAPVTGVGTTNLVGRVIPSGPLNEYQEATALVWQTYLDAALDSNNISLTRSNLSLISTAHAQNTTNCGAGNASGISYVGGGIFMAKDTTVLDKVWKGLFGQIGSQISGVGGKAFLSKDFVYGYDEENHQFLFEFLKSCHVIKDDTDEWSDSLLDKLGLVGFTFCIPVACAHEYVHLQFYLHDFFADWTEEIWDSLSDATKAQILKSLPNHYTDLYHLSEYFAENFFSEFLAFIFSATAMDIEEAIRFFSGNYIANYEDSEVLYFHTAFGAFVFERGSERFYIALYDDQGKITHISLLTGGALGNYFAKTWEKDLIQTDGQILVIRLENNKYRAFINTGFDKKYEPIINKLDVRWEDGMYVIDIPPKAIDYIPGGGKVRIQNVVVDGRAYSWLGVEGPDGIVKGIIPPRGLFKGLPAGMMIMDPDIKKTIDGKTYLVGTISGGKRVAFELDEQTKKIFIKTLMPPSQSEASYGGCGVFNFAAGCGSLWSGNYNPWTGESDNKGWNCLGVAAEWMGCGSY